MIRVNKQAGVLEIVMDDGSRGNTVDLEWCVAMEDALAQVDGAIQVVLLRAEGSNFCFGGDVSNFAGEDPEKRVGTLASGVHRVVRRIVMLDVPVLVLVQGWAVGVGFSLVLLGDLVIASKSARFRTAYVALGLTGDGGITSTLPRRLPPAIALDLLLSNRVLSSEEASALGLVSRVTADEELQAVGLELAGSLAAGPSAAQRAVKRLVRQGDGASLDCQLDREEAAMRAAAASPEGREGVAAFLESRSPRFRMEGHLGANG